MSVFEDLIGELKNENLLEETVIATSPSDAAALADRPSASGFKRGDGSGVPLTTDGSLPDVDIPQIERPASETDFFRKRATDEVSSLQMVEHVLSGVEREHMKVTSIAYDDLNAKRALHKFLQVLEDPESQGHAEAEFALRQETEAWSFALYERDQKISVANIRRFCEESRPVLSSQALLALARFYRNSPYSEDVRGKFDYVMTRLFSRDAGEGKRTFLFEHSEMLNHINTLYANWSSISLYTQEDDQVEVLLTVTRFEELTAEVEVADSFDELLETEFFNRVRAYKEETSEMFYVPDVLASAISCNLAIGNQYVELIGKERSAESSERLEEKYGVTYDHLVSNAAGRTLQIADLLAMEPETQIPEDVEDSVPAAPVPQVKQPAKPKAKAEAKRQKSAFNFFGVNKWVLLLCFVAVLVGGGVYIWAEKIAGGSSAGEVVAKSFKIDDPEIKKHVRKPSQTADSLYVIAEPSFETLSEEEKRGFLKKLYVLGSSRNMSRVNVLNKEGRTIASATKDGAEIFSK